MAVIDVIRSVFYSQLDRCPQLGFCPKLDRPKPTRKCFVSFVVSPSCPLWFILPGGRP
jgi:hypothetical protein